MIDSVKFLLKQNWPLLVITAVWFVVFWDMNTGQTVVGFRDSAYLYYPYFQWIDSLWAQGEIPLWNPYCDLGYPVVADGTSSVFYPGKLLFLCRFLSFSARYGLYLSVHVWLAAFFCYFAARRLGCSPIGSGVAAFSYAFGGPVLFQLTNVVYLVSAAWLPLGMYFVLNIGRRCKLTRSLAGGATAAMMILGGDPQMAYLLGVMCCFNLLIPMWVHRQRYSKQKVWRAKCLDGCGNLAIFVLTTFLLAAVQILPTYAWSQQSGRLTDSMGVVEKSLEPQPGSRIHDVYEFSLPPWSLFELVCPNISGKPFPFYCRWTDMLPGADRIWTPSLYMGLATLVLAIGAIRFIGCGRHRVSLTWIAVVFGLASFGWYGPVWLIREMLLAGNFSLPVATEKLGAQFGGVYWLATLVLPEFDSFRYPAKLFTVASLTLSLLAAFGFDGKKGGKAAYRWLVVTGVLAVTAWIIAEPLCQFIGKQCDQLSHPFFGPFDKERWYSGFYQSIYHLLIVTAAIGVLSIIANVKPRWSNTTNRILFGILVGDLLVANWWLLSEVNSANFTTRTQVESAIESVQGKGQSFCLARPSEIPAGFRNDSSGQRLEQIINWQRETLHPKHHLTLANDCRVELFGSFTTIEHQSMKEWRNLVARELDSTDPFFINGIVHFDFETNRVDLRIKSNDNTKCWLVDTISAGTDNLSFEQRNLVENSQVDWRKIQSDKFEVSINAPEPSILVCPVLPDPGWKVRVLETDSSEQAIRRRHSGSLFLQIEFPEGVHKFVMEYRPNEFWIGLVLSLCGWGAAFFYCLRLFVSRRIKLPI